MSDYRIICIVRGSDGEVETLGYSRNGNGVIYDDRWTVEQARAALEAGHRLYIVSPSTGEQTDLKLYEGHLRIPEIGGLPACGGRDPGSARSTSSA
jgi:hypothetical protein